MTPQRAGSRRGWRRYVALGGAILLVGLGVSACLPAGNTYEWGRPVAFGGPGPSPTRVSVSGEIGIDAGNASDLAILPNGSVAAWGTTEVAASASMSPVIVPGLKNVVQVADGDHDFVALEAPGAPLVHVPITSGACPNSTVWTWGRDIYNDLGLGVSTTTQSTPQEVIALRGLGVVQVVAASWHMFALTCTGRVYVWGWNEFDDLGMGTVGDQPVPVLNPYLTSLTGGSATGVMLTTGSFGAGILVNGKAYGWGNNGQLECGCGTTAAVVGFPTPVTQPVLFSYIDQGGDYPNNGHTLAIDGVGRAWCWGDNELGQCGIGASSRVGSPVLVPGVSDVTQVAAGGVHSILLDASGNVWTFGSNKYGQVGNGSSVQLTAVRVLGGITTISAGAEHSLTAG